MSVEIWAIRQQPHQALQIEDRSGHLQTFRRSSCLMGGVGGGDALAAVGLAVRNVPPLFLLQVVGWVSDQVLMILQNPCYDLMLGAAEILLLPLA